MFFSDNKNTSPVDRHLMGTGNALGNALEFFLKTQGLKILPEDMEKYGFNLAAAKTLFLTPYSSPVQPLASFYRNIIFIPIRIIASIVISAFCLIATPFIAMSAVKSKCYGENDKAKEKAMMALSYLQLSIVVIPVTVLVGVVSMISIITRTLSTLVNSLLNLVKTQDEENVATPLLRT